jgi:hypothetical protein
MQKTESWYVLFPKMFIKITIKSRGNYIPRDNYKY